MNTLSEERFTEISEFHQSTTSRVKKFQNALSENGQHEGLKIFVMQRIVEDTSLPTCYTLTLGKRLTNCLLIGMPSPHDI